MLAEEKGITFTYTSEEEAELYFLNSNNYLRTASYRKNYVKYQNGKDEGKYVGLDFAYLTELSTIDMHLRFLLIKMCLDVEHSIKVSLIKRIEKQPGENGYDIVHKFLSKHPKVLTSIEQKSDSTFTGDLIQKYFLLGYEFDTSNKDESCPLIPRIIDYDCPVWVFLELLSFGELLNFYTFFDDYFSDEVLPCKKNVLNLVKSLRNACAHNNCIINDLRPCSETYSPGAINQYIARIPEISDFQRRKKLGTKTILEIVALLYVYDNVVDTKVKTYRILELKSLLRGRFLENKIFFENNDLIKSTYNFFLKIVDNMG